MMDYRIGLQEGYYLESPKNTYVVESELGRGASSIVYGGYYTDIFDNRHSVRIKEYAPYAYPFKRDKEGALIIDNVAIEQFCIAMKDFSMAYKRNVEIRNTEGMMNSTVDAIEIFETNNTCYYVMSCDEGLSYDKYQDETLKEVFERIRTLLLLVGEYHRKGILLLDLKPSNIFVLPETKGLIKFFDFDTVVLKDKVHSSDEIALSFSEGFSSYELRNGKRESVCEAADIFSIGAIVFWKLFGRTPRAKECSISCDIDFTEMIFDYEQYNPELYAALNSFFHKTLTTSPLAREHNAEKLLNDIESLIKLSDLESNYINGISINPNSKFIGRESELDQIHSSLLNENVLFLSGIGGIGKTELARFYAAKYQGFYDKVIFSSYVVDIKTMVNDDNVVSIQNFNPGKTDNENDYFWIKTKKLKELCNQRTLFIVDNFDNLEDENLSRLIGIGCKFIFTTRRDCSHLPYTQITINTLDYPAAYRLFSSYYSVEIKEHEREYVDRILQHIRCHTYTVELLAKQMSASRIKPQKMWEYLNEGKITKINEKISQKKDGELRTGTATEHIEKLFDFAQIKDEKKIDVLRNASLLITNAGIELETFKNICGYIDYSVINELIDEGWFIDNRETEKIYVHPIVSEILAERYKPNAINCETSIKYLITLIDRWIESETINHQNAMSLIQHVSFASKRIIACEDKSVLSLEFLNKTVALLNELYVFKEASQLAEWLCKYVPFIDHTADFEIEVYENYADIMLYEGNAVIAEAYYLKALSLALQTFGKVNSYAAKLYNDMGKVYVIAEDYDMAVISALKAFSIRLDLVAEQGLSKRLLKDMGLLYFDLSNDDSMLNYYRIEVIGQFQLLNGKAPNDVIMNICNTKDIVTEDVRKKVLAYYKDATDKRIKNYGRYTMDSATAIHNMGVLYDIFNEFDLAVEKYEEALQVKSEIMGEDHISCAVTYENLGNSARKRGMLKEAISFYEKARQIYLDFNGEDDRNTKNINIIISDCKK